LRFSTHALSDIIPAERFQRKIVFQQIANDGQALIADGEDLSSSKPESWGPVSPRPQSKWDKLTSEQKKGVVVLAILLPILLFLFVLQISESPGDFSLANVKVLLRAVGYLIGYLLAICVPLFGIYLLIMWLADRFKFLAPIADGLENLMNFLVTPTGRFISVVLAILCLLLARGCGAHG
jgi:hypothetical protein